VRGSLALIFVLCLSSFAFAQTSFQPLQRVEETSGQYTWQLDLGYTPTGESGFGVDEFGQPYSYIRFSQGWRLGISGTFVLGAGWKMGFSVADLRTIDKETRKYSDHDSDLNSVHHDFAYSMSYEYRIDPKSTWDPRISFSFGHPWQGEVGATASLLRDPVVLVGRVSMLTQADEPHNWLSLTLGAGFVANAWIDLSASVGATIPTSGVGIPITTIGLRVRYSLDSESKKEVGGRITLSVQGQAPRLTFEAEASWRGP
jgi:hypothetical protein